MRRRAHERRADPRRTRSSAVRIALHAELLDRFEFVPQGISAEMIAERWKISREEMDQLAVGRRASPGRGRRGALRQRDRAGRDTARRGRARPGDPPRHPHREAGRPQDAVQVRRPRDRRHLVADFRRRRRGPRRVTGDGARTALTPRTKIVDQVTVGVDPVIMLTGPIPATHKLLNRTGSGSRTSTCSRSTKRSPRSWWPGSASSSLIERVNVNGGAMAIGHPVALPARGS